MKQRTPTTYDIVHLADNEWGNEVMQEIAEQWFREHPDTNYVEVIEHAGWRLGYRRDMSICASANDCAVLSPGSQPTEFSGFECRRPVIESGGHGDSIVTTKKQQTRELQIA